MSRRAVGVTVGHSGAFVGSHTEVAAAITAAQAGVTTALGLAGGTHNSTTELNTIATEITAITTALPTSDVIVDINLANVNTKDKLKAALNAAYELYAGSIGN